MKALNKQRGFALRLVASPAITDLYDTEHGIQLVRYPTWLIVALGLSGVLAFAITGFLGYPLVKGSPTTLEWRIFHEPWVLFLWFCALVITLQCAVLRHPSLRPRLVAMLTATVIFSIVIATAYLDREWVVERLNDILR